MSGEPEVLELAGTHVRSTTGETREFSFEVYGMIKKNSLAVLSCTTDRDLEQWMSVFANMGIIEDGEEPGRESSIARSSIGNYAHLTVANLAAANKQRVDDYR